MDRNELESPLSLPTAKLEQCDSEDMKENFNILDTMSLYKWGFELSYSVSLDQTIIYKGIYAYTSINLFVAVSDALCLSIKSMGSIRVNNLMHVKSSI